MLVNVKERWVMAALMEWEPRVSKKVEKIEQKNANAPKKVQKEDINNNIIPFYISNVKRCI
jgi:phage baseplate assembly protein W